MNITFLYLCYLYYYFSLNNNNYWNSSIISILVYLFVYLTILDYVSNFYCAVKGH